MIGIKKEKSDYQQPLKLKFKDICTAQKWMKAMMKLQEAQGWTGHMDTDKSIRGLIKIKWKNSCIFVIYH